ncbi:hypothetical protein P3X46_025693 [Hevea brasiliensis]|uniref:Protein kinase domain-containing protein n=1 Tax=Hevea brasiliensis TaxID=3981 RepID=A0ABQ9L6B9_HEVBR|nr:hypothetical protein P3X46_025693 [Hevea brasiliensis]
MELRITRLTTLWPSIHHFQVIVLFCTSLLCLQPPTDCLRNLGNETDRLALLEFKSKIGNDPHDVISSWNDSVNFCKWQGITCGRKHHRVTSLNLYGLSLSGTISPFIGNLTFLRFLNLRNNSFHGEIPQEVGRLSRLRHLNLTDNSLRGEIPLNITYSSELRILILARNRFVGKILDELGSLKKLVSLDLYGNNLTGEIPHSFGNLSSFKHLSVAVNNLAGNIPNKLVQLTGLTFFSVGVNNLIGTIPGALYNISSINVFSVPDNQLKGSLPANIGLTLRNLQDFYIGGNQFYGTIPSSFTNASQLEIFDISGNFFTGQAPNNFGDLRDLQQVNFEFNFLGSNTSQDLSFITSLSNCSNLEILSFAKNNFGGVLPAAIANLSTKLSLLGAGGNRISGRLPSEIRNLVNLYALGLEENHFSGTIPISFGKLRKLQKLYLHTNLLSGQIPPSLGNLSQLYELHLDIPELQLPACPIKRKKHKNSPLAIILATVISSIVLSMAITSLRVLCWRKSRKNPSSSPFYSSSQPRNLNLLQRFRVAMDLSSALHYLHDLCETPIIHCDLKPSNILLDDDMTAHVGDFGLARLLSKTSSNSSQDQTSSIGIRGTIGYVPPEYGIGGEPTTYGDVYSFGIILLEIITGRRPIDKVFTDGLNLHNFVRSKLLGQVMQVLDPKLIATGEVGAEEFVEDNENESDDGQTEIQENNVNVENMKLQGSNVQKCVVSVLKIGLACSAKLPGDRMNMTDVTRKLNIITESFLHASAHRERQIVNQN